MHRIPREEGRLAPRGSRVGESKPGSRVLKWWWRWWLSRRVYRASWLTRARWPLARRVPFYLRQFRRCSIHSNRFRVRYTNFWFPIAVPGYNVPWNNANFPSAASHDSLMTTRSLIWSGENVYIARTPNLGRIESLGAVCRAFKRYANALCYIAKWSDHRSLGRSIDQRSYTRASK